MDAENGFNDDEPESPPITSPEPALELELHADTSKMEDDEEDEISTATLVKLVQTEPQESSAQVPRQLKRRSSDDDDDDDDHDDDDDREEETHLDETYFYEYSMNHLNDQQLNYRRTHLSPLDHDSDLKLYLDSLVDVKQHKTPKTDESTSRSNHPRKKQKCWFVHVVIIFCYLIRVHILFLNKKNVYL